jgi:hypothetical protein
MKNYILIALLFTLSFGLTANAQDIPRMEELVEDLKDQAEELVMRTRRDIKKKEFHTGIEIESAFLAEQFRASIHLTKRIIGNKYHLSEVRYAGMVLAKLSEQFPTDGPNGFEWNRAKNTIYDMSRELRGLNLGGSIKNAGFRTKETGLLGTAVWSGMVDADVFLKIRGDKINSQAASGAPESRGAYIFTSEMPRNSRIHVRVRIKNGRGQARVIEQPDRNNDYTAMVQIRDEPNGAKRYTLEIYWYKK